MTFTLIFGALCFAGGVWLLLRALSSRSRRVALLRNSVQVSGKVVRLEGTTTEGDVMTTFAPVVEYKAGENSYELKLSPRHDTSACGIGKKVVVFYEKGQPENATHAQRMWDVNLVCALSFIPVFIGAGMLFTVYQETLDHSEPLATDKPQP